MHSESLLTRNDSGVHNCEIINIISIYNISCHMQDRYAFEQSRPPIDPQQDWNLIRGENENEFTTLEFSRKWVTCDERDRDIEVRLSNIVV